MMQHRKPTTKFLLRLSFLLAEKNIEISAQKPSLNGLSTTLAKEIKKKRFLNPTIGDMPITEENGRVTIGAS